MLSSVRGVKLEIDYEGEKDQYICIDKVDYWKLGFN